MKKFIDSLLDIWRRMTNGERVIFILVCVGSFLFGYIFFRMLFGVLLGTG